MKGTGNSMGSQNNGGMSNSRRFLDKITGERLNYDRYTIQGHA